MATNKRSFIAKLKYFKH